MLVFGKIKIYWYLKFMFLVVGLGNPGVEYENTRHNVGFMLADEFACRFKLPPKSFKVNKGLANFFQVKSGEKTLVIAKPLTFMNNSGRAAKFLLKKFNITNDKLIVVHDDLDLPLGVIRIKRGSSSGGHLGVDSVVSELGTNLFFRVRVGIGRPPARKDAAVFVLEEFKKKELEQIEFAVNKAAGAILDLIKIGLDAVMNKYN